MLEGKLAAWLGSVALCSLWSCSSISGNFEEGKHTKTRADNNELTDFCRVWFTVSKASTFVWPWVEWVANSCGSAYSGYPSEMRWRLRRGNPQPGAQHSLCSVIGIVVRPLLRRPMKYRGPLRKILEKSMYSPGEIWDIVDVKKACYKTTIAGKSHFLKGKVYTTLYNKHSGRKYTKC
jgi:hypothetical protein